MTMAEFNIRLFSFNRQREHQEMLAREQSYYALIGSHIDPKKLPKSKQQFWVLPSERLELKKNLDNKMNMFKKLYLNKNKKDVG